MAALVTPRSLVAGTSFADRAVARVANIFSVLGTWNDTRITRNSLSKLSDRELDDIGLCRGDIEDIVR